MRKLWISIALLAGLALSACQAASPRPTAPPTPQPTGTQAKNAVGCTVVSILPTPGPTEASLFPPVGASDWVSGATNPRVTFLEYSDFQ
jgi:nitrous oxide reductase accessory protein NosL